MLTALPPVVVETIRGGVRESVHRGEAAVVDASGRVLYCLGDPHRMTYVRSAAKPIQALAVVETGAAAHYGFTPAELAVMSASHNGEACHVEAVAAILKKIGLGPEALRCGSHLPLYAGAAEHLLMDRRSPGPLHNNCSGKHAGMLAICRHRGFPIEDYPHSGHPVQAMNQANLALMAGLDPGDMTVGVEGCGSPAYALPLAAMARAYARLAEPSGLPAPKQAAAAAVVDAMRRHPEMVGGTGRLCTRLLARAETRLVAKSGAEGVYCVGVGGRGWGLAFKVEDGASRAVPPAVIEFLLQLGVLDAAAAADLVSLHHPILRNHRGEACGAVRPAARLQQAWREEQCHADQP